MSPRWWHAVLFLTTPWLGGCVSQPLTPAPQETLFAWVDQALIPHLVSQLRQSPRLRGARFAVVRLEGGRISPHIDGLTLDLRHRIGDGLARHPQIHQTWQADLRPLHGARRPRAECRDLLRADFFIGIETSRDADGRLRVAVQVLDPRDESRVGGAGLVWRGWLTAAQARARRQWSEDEVLRGLRPLPFRADQIDLAAAWLADRLSCRLRTQGLGGKGLHLVHPVQGPVAMDDLARLLGDNLSQLGEVRLVRAGRHADYLLYLDYTPIAQGLAQVWIRIEPQGRHERVAGLDVGAYVRLAASQPSSPHPPSPAPRILDIALEGPRDPALCGTVDPWRAGRKALHSGETLETGGCLRPRIRTRHADRIWLLWLDPEGGLRRLPEYGCGAVLRFGVTQGVASLYVLASRGKGATQALKRLLQALPRTCPQDPVPRADGDWLQRLDRLLRDRPREIAWAVRRIPIARTSGELP